MIPQSEKQPPKILQEEDAPFDKVPHVGDDLPKSKSADKQLNLRRFNLGSSILGWCIFWSFVFAYLFGSRITSWFKMDLKRSS